MVAYRKNQIAASLEYDTSSGGLEIIKPIKNLAQALLGITSESEASWQKEVRHYDINAVGILGHSLDIIGFTAAAAKLHFVNPITGVEIPNQIIQERIHQPKWRDDKDIFEMLFMAVRNLASIGEFDLVKIGDEYDIFQCSQRIKSTDTTITYRQRDSKKDDLITINKENIERCFVSKPGSNHEAYAPTRRILPQLRLYAQIVTQFQRIAFSNSLMTKLLYLGPDNGEWAQQEEYTSQFNNPNEAVPPIVNDMVELAKGIASGESSAPWYPTMGDEPPTGIDLTTSFDEQARNQLHDCDVAIATGLNIPAKFLVGENVTHFGEALHDEQVRRFGVEPLLKIVLKFLDKHIYAKYPTLDGYSSKLWYTFDELASTSLNPAQFIELFKIGVIGTAGIQRHLKLSKEDAYISPEDIKLRRELLTGDSGLQQAQLAQRDAQKLGQDRVAANPTNALTHGNKRQGQAPANDPSRGPIAPISPTAPVGAALKNPVKKKT